jgi:hypothetical protein
LCTLAHLHWVHQGTKLHRNTHQLLNHTLCWAQGPLSQGTGGRTQALHPTLLPLGPE